MFYFYYYSWQYIICFLNVQSLQIVRRTYSLDQSGFTGLDIISDADVVTKKLMFCKSQSVIRLIA